MKKIFPVALAALMILAQPVLAQTPAPAASTPAATADTDADHKAIVEAAKTALKGSSSSKIVDQMVDGMAKNPQLHLTAKDITDIKASVDTAALDKIMLDALEKTFNLQELKMLDEIYESPTGQSINKKMPAYMTAIMPAIQAQVKQAITAHLQQATATPAAPAAPAVTSTPAKN